MRKFLMRNKNIQRSTYLWNAVSAAMNSFQTMLILVILTRLGTDTDSSVFVIAYAVGNLMLQVGKYGIRQFQVTDVAENYSFKDYLIARCLTVALMLLCSVGYVGYNLLSGQYTLFKGSIILLICLVKSVEAFEDVLHGRLQQLGRLDMAGKILGIRLFLYIIEYTVIFILTRNLLLTTVVTLLTTLIVSIVMNQSVRSVWNSPLEASVSRIRTLLKTCFPLCLSACLNMYVANAPKYIIDTVVSDEVQTAINIVFMPVFVIALLGTFIFQPALKNMGLMWHEEKRQELQYRILKLSAIVVIVAILIAVAGYILGIPILEMIYKVDLSSYRLILVIFILDGGLIALHNLFIMVITIVRRQKYMIYGYFAAAAMELLIGSTVLKSFGITALSLFFTVVLTLLLLYFILLTITVFKKEGSDGTKN